MNFKACALVTRQWPNHLFALCKNQPADQTSRHLMLIGQFLTTQTNWQYTRKGGAKGSKLISDSSLYPMLFVLGCLEGSNAGDLPATNPAAL
jgi:hypothetical protein